MTALANYVNISLFKRESLSLDHTAISSKSLWYYYAYAGYTR